MGKYLKQYEKDNMRMAMLKQEEIFRDQVHELHRLYRVQKVLMNDMKVDIKRQRKSLNSRTKIEIRNMDNETALQQPCYSCQDQQTPHLGLKFQAEEHIGKDDKNVMQDDDEDNDLELTLATGSRRRRKKENSLTSDSGASFSSSSTESGAKVKLNGNEWGGFQEADINLSNYQRERKSVFNVQERMREERVQQPPWLFHCLSLHTT